MTLRFTPMGRALAGAAVLLFLWAYILGNIAVALAGSGLLFYLAYRRLDLHFQLKRMGIEVRREVMEGFIHKDSPATIRVEVEADETIDVKLSELLPERFRLASGDLAIEGRVGRDKKLDLVYSLVPEERGSFRMGPVKLKLTEQRGLFRTEMEIDPGTELPVRVSRKDMELARLMARRKQFDLRGPAQRRQARTQRGDFKTVREYLPGDRFRDIDWKVTSRLTRLMTKEFEQETNVPTMVLVDSSLSMRELIKRNSKLDHCAALALETAVVMSTKGHPVGMVAFDENKVLSHIPPIRGDIDHVASALLALPTSTRTGGYPGAPDSTGIDGTGRTGQFLSAVGPFLVKGRRQGLTRDKTTGIFEAVRAILGQEETGMLIVLFSDLETNQPSIMRSARLAMSKKHRMVVAAPFSWSYHVRREGLSEGSLERMYEAMASRQKMHKKLMESGIKVIELEPKDTGEKVVLSLRRMGQ